VPLTETSAEVEPADHSLSGTLERDADSVGIQLLDFNMVCSPSTAQLCVGGQLVTADGAAWQLPFHHVHTWVEEVRPTDYWDQGMAGYVQAALLIPEGIDDIDDDSARTALQELFGDREVINFLGDVSLEFAELEEISWLEPFRVPGDEKAFGSAFRLSAVAD